MTNLQDILINIDWKKNIRDSLGANTTLSDIDSAAHRLAVWSRQLEDIDIGNPALCFIREMQYSMQHSGALIGLCLYKPSASSSRTLLESCIYYTYFRSHLEELETLISNSKFYMSKKEIIEYHVQHTSDFSTKQSAISLVQKLELWYSRTSAIIHGQVPGTWNTNLSISQTSYCEQTHDDAVTTLLDGVKIANDLLFCTIGKKFWGSFAPDAKAILTKGMDAKKRQALSLDTR